MFFIPILPLDKLIIIAVVIVIVPYVYLLLCYKPITDKLQRKEVIPHCIITHILRLKVIWPIFKQLWAFFNSFLTDFFRLKVIWHIA